MRRPRRCRFTFNLRRLHFVNLGLGGSGGPFLGRYGREFRVGLFEFFPLGVGPAIEALGFVETLPLTTFRLLFLSGHKFLNVFLGIYSSYTTVVRGD